MRCVRGRRFSLEASTAWVDLQRLRCRVVMLNEQQAIGRGRCEKSYQNKEERKPAVCLEPQLSAFWSRGLLVASTVVEDHSRKVHIDDLSQQLNLNESLKPDTSCPACRNECHT